MNRRMDRNADVVLGAAVIAMGLVAGLYFFSSIAVMPALTAADDRTLVDAMQQMIDKIENPAFFLVFLGAPVLAAVALVQAGSSGSAKIAGWIIAGLALYTVMVVITFAVHLPLNDDLVNAGDLDRIENLAAVRDDFVTPWVAWDIVRTLVTTAAFGCLVWALVLRGRMLRAEQPPHTAWKASIPSTHTAERTERIPQGDLRLLETALAQQLLRSSIPTRLAFLAADGTPRVVPTWFEWNGAEVVMATYVAGRDAGIRHPAARIAALRANPAVALTIDTEDFPSQSLTIRGRAEIDEVDGLAPEYVASAHRYLGEAAADIVAAMDKPGTVQARIVVRPMWVGLLDFAERLPSPLGGV